MVSYPVVTCQVSSETCSIMYIYGVSCHLSICTGSIQIAFLLGLGFSTAITPSAHRALDTACSILDQEYGRTGQEDIIENN